MPDPSGTTVETTTGTRSALASSSIRAQNIRSPAKAGNSIDCRQRAGQCLDNPTAKSNFMGLATTWAKLAEELEMVTVVSKDTAEQNTRKT